MPRPVFQLEAATKLEPLQQGNLDGLCGLYALINGLRVALYPTVILTPSQQKYLFDEGIGYLSRSRRLPEVIRHGMQPRLWRRLSMVMALEAEQITGFPILIRDVLAVPERLTSRMALRLIRGSIRGGAPVLLTLWGRYNHTSVAVGFSETRLILFDSFGFRWVTLRTIGIDHATSAKRHRLKPEGVVVLSRT